MAKKVFCGHCFKMVDYFIVKDCFDGTVLGEYLDFNVEIERPVCARCNHIIEVDVITRRNELKVYDAYKKQVGLLTSTELIKIKNDSGLDWKAFAKSCGLSKEYMMKIVRGSIQPSDIDKVFRSKVLKNSKNVI